MTRIVFAHPPDPRMPWTDELVASAVGKPLELVDGGNVLGKIVDARIGAAGHAEFEVEMFSVPSATVDVTKGEVVGLSLVHK